MAKRKQKAPETKSVSGANTETQPPAQRYTPGDFEPANVAEAIIAASGNMTYAAALLGCGSQTVRRYIDRFEVCAAAAAEAREIVIDAAEDALLALVNDRDGFTANARAKAAMYLLDTHGKGRGYGKAVAINGNLDLSTWADHELMRLAKGEPIELILRDRTNANAIPHAGTTENPSNGGA